MQKKKPLGKTVVKGNRSVKVVRACTVMRSPEELYAFWRKLENLPQFMRHVVSVTQTSPVDSHWVVKGPVANIEWDAVIFNERENNLIAWRTKEGAIIPNAGSVRFEPAPGGRGTEVIVALEYNPPGGRLGRFLAKVFGEEPSLQLAGDLRRFQALMETGEIPTAEGQPVGGSRAGKERKRRAAAHSVRSRRAVESADRAGKPKLKVRRSNA